MGQVAAVLPFLAVLACPLMMGVCLWGMCRVGRGAAADQPTVVGTPEERITQLHRQLAAVEAELAARPTATPASGRRAKA